MNCANCDFWNRSGSNGLKVGRCSRFVSSELNEDTHADQAHYTVKDGEIGACNIFTNENFGCLQFVYKSKPLVKGDYDDMTIDQLRTERRKLLFMSAAITDDRELARVDRTINVVNKRLYELTGNEIYGHFVARMFN